MKIDEGMVDFKELLNKRFSILGNKTLSESGFEPINLRKKVIKQWQELALQIIKEFKVVKEEQGLIFKVCKQFPTAYVLHSFLETKELAKGPLRSHYFIKLVFKK